MSTADNLRRLRLAKGFTRAELSKRSGVAHQVISHYESGRNAIGIKNVSKLARALECEPCDIDERYKGVDIENDRQRIIEDDALLLLVDNWRDIPLSTRIQLSATGDNAAKEVRLKNSMKRTKMTA